MPFFHLLDRTPPPGHTPLLPRKDGPCKRQGGMVVGPCTQEKWYPRLLYQRKPKGHQITHAGTLQTNVNVKLKFVVSGPFGDAETNRDEQRRTETQRRRDAEATSWVWSACTSWSIAWACPTCASSCSSLAVSLRLCLWCSVPPSVYTGVCDASAIRCCTRQPFRRVHCRRQLRIRRRQSRAKKDGIGDGGTTCIYAGVCVGVTR